MPLHRIALGLVCIAIPLVLSSQRPTLTATRELLLSGAELDFVPITMMVVDGHGRMHVWQDDDARIRRFEADGTELESVGRGGEGPGEFRMRSFGGMVGDTFWVSDPMLRRTTFFGPDGKLLRTQRWPFGVTRGEEYFAAGVGVQPYIVEPGGTQIVRFGRGERTDLPSWWKPSAAADVFLRVDSTGQFLKLLTTIPPSSSGCRRELIVPGRSPGTIMVPFCEHTFRIASIESDRIVYASPDSAAGQGRYAVRATRLDGRQLYSIRVAERPVRIPREVADSARRDLMRPRPRPPEVQRAIERSYGRMRFPDFYPPLSSLFVGRDGTAWIGLRASAGDRQWLVIAPDGKERGTLTLPASFRMSAADGNRIWGTSLDEDDLPSVVRYRIQ